MITDVTGDLSSMCVVTMRDHGAEQYQDIWVECLACAAKGCQQHNH